MLTRIRAFLRDQSGASSIEYGTIGVILSIGIIIAATQIGNSTTNNFDAVSSGLPDGP